MRTERILKLICQHFKLTRTQIGTKVTQRDVTEVVEGRQAAAYFLHRHTDYTLDQIANILGYSGKMNVNLARKKITEIMSGNHEFEAKMRTIEEKILTRKDK